MALFIVMGLLAVASFLAIRAPFRALVVVVFFAPWAGLDVDIGLRVTAYLIFLAPLAGVFLLAVAHGGRAQPTSASMGVLWLVVLYAVIWSLVQIPFLPEAEIRGGALRAPEVRALVQIVMFLITISPVFLLPWLMRTLDQVRYLVATYLVSIVALASLGWLQLLIWITTGADPIPVGFVDYLLGGHAGQRSGQFVFDGSMVYRMSSFGGEPKGLGAGLAVGLLVIQSGIRPRARWGSALWPFLFVSMLATFSTMAILGWFGASLVQLAFGEKFQLVLARNRLVISRQTVYLGVVILMLVPGAFIAFPESRIIQVIESRTIERVTGGGHVTESQFRVLEDFNQAVVDFLGDSPVYALTGVGLGNVHLYADPFLPDYAVRYARGTPFVAKSYVLRWVSELGILSLAAFLIWWVLLVTRARRRTGFRRDTATWGPMMTRTAWGVLALWLVSGYITPQFFLMTGMVVGIGRLLRVQNREHARPVNLRWLAT